MTMLKGTRLISITSLTLNSQMMIRCVRAAGRHVSPRYNRQQLHPRGGRLSLEEVLPAENCPSVNPGLQDGQAPECSSQVAPVVRVREQIPVISGHGLPCRVSRGPDRCRYLWLVSDGAHAAVVYESEHALTVVARDELCWDADVVDVRVAGATSHLKDTEADFGIR